MMPKKITKTGLTINISKKRNKGIEKLVDIINDLLSKEENMDVRAGLKIAKLEAMIIQADELVKKTKQIKSN